jgi:hypothetical protein
LWLVAVAYFALRYALWGERADLLALSAAVGLALMTKGTAYLYGSAVLAGIFLPARPDGRRRLLRAAWVVAAGALLLNGPQYWRNFELSGSPLGFDSAQGDGFFRWRNDTLGWRQTVSNLLRNGSEELGAPRSVAWNRAVYAFVLRAHALLGIDPNDPATTWKWTAFTPPVSSNHETNANNRWHLLILLAVLLGVAWRRTDWLGYLLALALSFLLVCFYLKWQPFFARMFLPLFVLGAPMAGLAIERLRPVALQVILALFLVNNARPYLFENWIRPWKGPNSIWKMARDDQYFSDMNTWHNRDSFLRSVALTQHSGCHLVGIDINHFQLEYPFQALLRECDPDVFFVHTGVDNGSGRYGQPVTPCVILCMDCVGVQDRMDRYRSTGPPIQVDRFLLFIRGSSAAPTAPPPRAP